MLLQLNVRYKTRVAPKLTGIRNDHAAEARSRRACTDEPKDRPVTMRLYDTARRAVVPVRAGRAGD